MIEKSELGRFEFEYLILDEAQRIKNKDSVLSKDLRTYNTRSRILLTGTPLQNNLNELWALLNFLMPKLFDTAEDFTNLFTVEESQ
jgi:SNF2 family DNA or RNA helicase